MSINRTPHSGPASSKASLSKRSQVVFHGSSHRRAQFDPKSSNVLWTTDRETDGFLKSYQYIHRIVLNLPAGKLGYLVDLIDEAFIDAFAVALRKYRMPADERNDVLSSLYSGLDGYLNGGGSCVFETDFWEMDELYLVRYLRDLGYAAVRLDDEDKWMCVLDVACTNVVVDHIRDNGLKGCQR